MKDNCSFRMVNTGEGFVELARIDAETSCLEINYSRIFTGHWWQRIVPAIKTTWCILRARDMGILGKKGGD